MKKKNKTLTLSEINLKIKFKFLALRKMHNDLDNLMDEAQIAANELPDTKLALSNKLLLRANRLKSSRDNVERAFEDLGSGLYMMQ